MKKLKCIKCGLWFKDRQYPEELTLVNRELCMNCNFVWKCIGIMLHSIPEKTNRYVAIKLEDVVIRKKTKING